MLYQLIIFDWDGTLMDSQGKIVTCMQHAARLCEMPVPAEEDVKHIIGISLLPAIIQLFGLKSSHAEHTKAEQLRDAYKHAFIELDQTPSPMFEGAIALLQDLHATGVDMAVATGKARRGLERAWQQTDTKKFFVNSRTSDEAESKPSPDMLEQILRDQNLTPSQAVMIGDTSYDMQMARDIGMDRIAVSYGVHEIDKLNTQKPNHIVDNVVSLRNILLNTL